MILRSLCESVAAGSDLVKMQTSDHSFSVLPPALPGETSVREGKEREMKTKRKIQPLLLRFKLSEQTFAPCM